MLLHKGDFVRFRWNGRLHDGQVREDERPGLGLVDVETDRGVWHGLSRRAITPLRRPFPEERPPVPG